jgi:uncharacterized circularly permuted ATP-grasp superfamily protein/uncharacterized alpha-E superfamily protein
MNNDISLSLLNSYKTIINEYDEVLDANGQVKPYWQTLFDTIEQLGMDVLELRNQEIISKLKENGVTYNVYESNQGINRPWKLDPIPFILHQNEWEQIEKGLIQRAHLLDLMLKDISGPQLLIKNGIVPPELVFDNTGFLLPCFDIKQKLNTQLLMYACDMIRGADGKMWLLDNRTQSPSGSGYALENRTIIGKVFPELNKNVYRSRLAPYFIELQQTIANLGNFSNEEPNVVLLTPGPGSETYFEHVYLSSYLGYALVQGSDLLVRDGFVWLKSIDQLERVDVIIRRIDDEWLDPLELNQDSLLGVPGLLNAIRLGNVSVVNPPGTSVLENYGLMSFMQNACEFFYNEKLIINSVATWWCGQEKELNYVIENLHKLIIKKSNRKQGFKTVFCRLLTSEELEELKNTILNCPKDFIAQEEVNFSTTPSYIDGKIEPRLASLRAFLVSDGNNYKVMQGGLTRSSPVKDKFIISNRLGGIAKDTWIVTDVPVEFNERQLIHKNSNSTRTHAITSRNAENLFWVGRLCERTLSLTNFLKIIIDRLNENVSYKNQKQPEYLIVLLKSLTHLTLTYPGFTDEEDTSMIKNPTNEILELISNSSKAGALTYNINLLIYTINQVSETWNLGTRRIINLLGESLDVLCNSKTNTFNEINYELNKLHTRLFAFNGNILETLPRDTGFYLLEAGKNVERILSLVSVLRSTFSFENTPETENVIIEAVLENNHLLQRYRYTNKSNADLVAVLNMIFLEENLPYTLSFLLDELSYCLRKLPKSSENNRMNLAEKTVLETVAIVKLVDTEQLVNADKGTLFRPALDKTLMQIFELISKVSTDLTSMYFNHSILQHSFLETTESIKTDEI